MSNYKPTPFEKKIIDMVKPPPIDMGEEQKVGSGFNLGYNRGHSQAKTDARAVARDADQRIADLEKQLAAEKQRADRAEAKLRRLPVTADDVPVAPIIDHVFHPDFSFGTDDVMEPLDILPRSFVRQELARHELDGFDSDYTTGDWFAFGVHYDPDTHARDGLWISNVWECFSTPQAALAIAKAEGGGK